MRHPVGAVALLATAALAGCTQTTPAPAPAAPPIEASATATTTPAAAPPPPAATATWPQALTIPKLAVATQIVGQCETLPDGRIEPPADIHATCVTGRDDTDPVGAGTTALTGHTTRAASTGALEQIGRLTPGDTVTTGTAVWTVTQVGTWPATALPPELFTADGPRRVILTTCHLTPAVLAGAPYTDTDVAVAVPAS